MDSVEFDDMFNQINAGQTGLANDIAGLIMENVMIHGNTGQTEIINLTAGKAKFDTEIASISSRHMDIEKRLLAIDQFSV